MSQPLPGEPKMLGTQNLDVVVWLRQQAERHATMIESMCHWRQNLRDVARMTTHREFHRGNLHGQTGVCPYEAVAAVLRGQPDPRDV